MPIEAAISDDDSEDGSDESIHSVVLEEEVDINIHFHCEHCIKISKCIERVKPGWCCEIISCPHECGLRFHACKYIEHKYLCSHIRVPCINESNGCPKQLLRYQIPSHLPVCPASVVVCNAEWNRWALGARERELITLPKGVTASFDPSDLDVVFNLHNQNLVNEMHSYSKDVRLMMCNKITKRFPSLPISIRGAVQRGDHVLSQRNRSQSTTDDEEEALTPGLSLSMCTEILRGQKASLCIIPENQRTNSTIHFSRGVTNGIPDIPADDSLLINDDFNSLKIANDHEYVSKCCIHGILKDICRFCQFDPDEPHFKVRNVWKEKVDFKKTGEVSWKKEARVEKIRKKGPFDIFTYKDVDEGDEDDSIMPKSAVEKGVGLESVRFRTPPPSRLTPADLVLEMGLKHYSRHQVKPRAMFTFLCLEHVRRDSYCNHYQNVHTEIQEGLDGWLFQRCPLHTIGCPFSVNKLYPGRKDGEIIFCPSLKSFGIKPVRDLDRILKSPHDSRSSSIERVTNSLSQVQLPIIMDSIPEDADCDLNYSDQNYSLSNSYLTCLPFEVLIIISRYLDDFSLNQLSMTCHFLREVCFNILVDRGLVMQEWVRSVDEESGKVNWNLGNDIWFFSKCFNRVNNWRLENEGAISNHLQECPFNIRNLAKEKFRYCPKNSCK